MEVSKSTLKSYRCAHRTNEVLDLCPKGYYCADAGCCPIGSSLADCNAKVELSIIASPKTQASTQTSTAAITAPISRALNHATKSDHRAAVENTDGRLKAMLNDPVSPLLQHTLKKRSGYANTTFTTGKGPVHVSPGATPIGTGATVTTAGGGGGGAIPTSVAYSTTTIPLAGGGVTTSTAYSVPFSTTTAAVVVQAGKGHWLRPSVVSDTAAWCVLIVFAGAWAL